MVGILKIPHACDFYAAPEGFPRASEVSNWVFCKLTRYRGEARGSIKQSGGINPEPCTGAAGWLWLVGAGRYGIPILESGKLILKSSYLQTRSREVCGARCPLTKPERKMSNEKGKGSPGGRLQLHAGLQLKGLAWMLQERRLSPQLEGASALKD